MKNAKDIILKNEIVNSHSEDNNEIPIENITFREIPVTERMERFLSEELNNIDEAERL